MRVRTQPAPRLPQRARQLLRVGLRKQARRGRAYAEPLPGLPRAEPITATAVAVDAHNIASQTTAQTSITLSSFTIASNSNRALYVWVFCTDSTTISSVTWNGSESLTQVWNVAQGADRLALYRRLAPTATTANVVASFSGPSDSESIVCALSLYNVDQSTPEATARTDSAGSSGNTRLIGCEGVADGLVIAASVCGTTASAARTAANVNSNPKYIAAGTRTQSAGATTLSPGAPTGRMYGDKEWCVVSAKNNATISFDAAWTKLDQQNSGASFTVAIAYRIYNGTNVDPAPSWTGSVACSAQRFMVRDNKADGTSARIHATNTGTGTTHSTTGANSTADNSTIFYVDVSAANTALGTPTNYTEDVDGGSATDAGRTVFGHRELGASGSGSGNISVTGANAAWVQWQIEIFRSDAGAQSTIREAEALNNFTTFAAAYETADTYNALGWDWTTGTTGFYIIGGVCVRPAASGHDLGTPSTLAFGTPTLDTPTLTQLHSLAAGTLAAGTPAPATPTLTQIHALAATALDAGSVVLGAPTLTQVHSLAAPTFDLSAPTAGTPSITQLHSLATGELTFGAPSPATPALTQIHGLEAVALDAGAAVLGTPSATQAHALTGDALNGAAFVLASPALTQIHGLDAIALAFGAPAPGAPTITQIHALSATAIVFGAPVLGHPALAAAELVFTTTASIAMRAASAAIVAIDLSLEIADAPPLRLNARGLAQTIRARTVAASIRWKD